MDCQQPQSRKPRTIRGHIVEGSSRHVSGCRISLIALQRVQQWFHNHSAKPKEKAPQFIRTQAFTGFAVYKYEEVEVLNTKAREVDEPEAPSWLATWNQVAAAGYQALEDEAKAELNETAERWNIEGPPHDV